MKNLLFLLIFLFPTLLYAQKKDLSPYKYIFINELNHQGVDYRYGITKSLTNAFISKGFIIANGLDPNNLPQDFLNNGCLLLLATPFYTDGAFSIKLSLNITDCFNERLFSTEVSGTATLTVDEAYGKVIRKMSKEIAEIPYSFNPSLTPKKVVEVPVNPNYNFPNSGLTEDKIRNYLDKNSIDPVEGIYKTYNQNKDNSPSYKIGVLKKAPGIYHGVIIESESSVWNPGEVKILIESTSINGVYSTKYFMSDKSKVETFATLDNNILKIDISKVVNNEANNLVSFIKLYPFNQSSNTGGLLTGGTGYNLQSSGTGFLISSNGLLVTNYHVVSSGSRFTATNTETEKTYELELLQNDKINDIAILKIKNLENNFPILPYKLSFKGKNGQSVFTIGYPLNDVMGENQKISNGIINAQSGVKDDSRYYQISVPIQPGNSGGALFDLEGNIIGITTATLNPEAVNTQVQNVNYALKINLLFNLISMLQEEEQVLISNSQPSKEIPLSILSEKYKNFVLKINTFR